jgi:outer membrane receptor protein involved in Fe transport
MTLRGSPAALGGSGHLLYKLTRHLSATAGVSQGFRAPNVDDAAILAGVGSRLEIPNGALRPERSINVEYGLRAQGSRGSLSVVVFQDRYRDLIDRAPALFNGLPFLDLNGNGIKDGKEQDIYQRQNVSRAAVYGFEVEALVSIADGWTWSYNTTWTRGTDLSLGQPLTRIPPLNGASRLTWQPRGSFWVEAAMVAATAQHRLAPADKTDVRIGPGGTAGYAVFHLRAGLSRSPLAGLSVALENLANRRYRLHGSGIDRPGINLVVGYTRAF